MGKHGFISVDPGFALGVASFGSHADPLKFAGQGLQTFDFAFFFVGQTLLLLFQPGGVVALPGDAATAIQFKNPASHVVKEVTVVGYGNYSTGESF